MGLYSCVCLMENQLKQDGPFKAEVTSWHQKEQVAFSDMLGVVRMVIWRDNLILRKAKNTSSLENITSEMAKWAEAIVRQMLQAA